MPIYEYLCTACSHRADILHGINDPGPLFCPACGREGTMRKQFAPPTIHFKGSGWAKKDRGSSTTGVGCGVVEDGRVGWRRRVVEGLRRDRRNSRGDRGLLGGASSASSKDGGTSTKDGGSSSKDTGSSSKDGG